TYGAEDFDKMLTEQKPKTVIVTVPDGNHHEYIIRALHAGCDVITEKPMTTDLRKLKAILDAQAETGRKVTVSFNYRYTPARTQLKDILMKGTIGEITAVDFRWHLDRVHGADYFRRWHRYKENSGGLLVHKATHHFDLMNWWLGSTPDWVEAQGSRQFYNPDMAKELGLQDHAPRCHDCTLDCDYRLDIEADPMLKELYLDAESQDGYFRDRCVFDEDIEIEDMMQLGVKYASGASMTYSLCAYSPWEGLEILFYGTKGTLSHKHVEVHGVFGGKRDYAREDNMETTLHLAGQAPEKLDVWQGDGDHGGADPVMLNYMFNAEGAGIDPYARSSGHIDGAWSILTGIAANLSMEEGRRVTVQDMLKAAGIAL
ncbi:MAG: Gfo/Idh/MocA family oxidoreductase, partial [Rhodobacteraceae bacterium]|nr:Gfo/Idh/MocA family oxidoreductase [Paracoccaceae bacterium]